MTHRELLREGEQTLESAGIAESKTDAWLLFEFVTGIDRVNYPLQNRETCPEDLIEKYRTLLSERAQHRPLQYLTGKQEFMGYEFYVNEHVLIPRQDTEVLVLEAEKHLHPQDKVLDLCTGSGCIILSLKKRTEICATASDISEEALKTAKKNAETLDAEVCFLKSDLFSAVSETFHCIVSNPPYIPTAVIGELMPEVRDHEPHLALDGSEDGLLFYRRIVAEAAAHLETNGWLLMEIGYDQGGAVAGMMKEAGYQEVEVIKDLSGLDRVVCGRRKENV